MSDGERFERLARPHLDAAYNLAYWIVRDAADAEDVVQDAYLRAFRAFAGFKGEAMRPWLLAIVRNSAYRLLRTRRKHVLDVPLDQAQGAGEHGAVAEIAAPDPSPEMALIAKADAELLRASLAQLAPAHREIVVLRDLEELSYSEIAEVLTIPQGTVMSRLSRARAELRRLWEEQSLKRCGHAL